MHAALEIKSLTNCRADRTTKWTGVSKWEVECAVNNKRTVHKIITLGGQSYAINLRSAAEVLIKQHVVRRCSNS